MQVYSKLKNPYKNLWKITYWFSVIKPKSGQPCKFKSVAIFTADKRALSLSHTPTYSKFILLGVDLDLRIEVYSKISCIRISVQTS